MILLMSFRTNMSYLEYPNEIINRLEKILGNKTMLMVKVVWIITLSIRPVRTRRQDLREAPEDFMNF